MRLTQKTLVVRTPGNPTATTRTEGEWICPDCDYFEEAERGDLIERRSG